MNQRHTTPVLRLLSHVLAVSVLVGPAGLVVAGCGTRVDDCNKVIGVHNAHVDEVKKLEMKGPEDFEALAKVSDKVSEEMAALTPKDETVKTKTSALVEAEKQLAVAIRAAGTAMAALKSPGADPGAVDKLGDDLKKASDGMTEKAGARDKAWDDFTGYCK